MLGTLYRLHVLASEGHLQVIAASAPIYRGNGSTEEGIL